MTERKESIQHYFLPKCYYLYNLRPEFVYSNDKILRQIIETLEAGQVLDRKD